MLADLVGLVHVVDGGHWVVGLDDVEVTDVKVLKSSFNFTAWQANELKTNERKSFSQIKFHKKSPTEVVISGRVAWKSMF